MKVFGKISRSSKASSGGDKDMINSPSPAGSTEHLSPEDTAAHQLRQRAAIARQRGLALEQARAKALQREKLTGEAATSIGSLTEGLQGYVAAQEAVLEAKSAAKPSSAAAALSDGEAHNDGEDGSSKKRSKKSKKRHHKKSATDDESASVDTEQLEELRASLEAAKLMASLLTTLSQLQASLETSVKHEFTRPVKDTLSRDVKGAAKAEKTFEKAAKSREQADKLVMKQMSATNIDLAKVADAEHARDDARAEVRKQLLACGHQIDLANTRIEAEAVTRSVNLVDAHARYFEGGLVALLDAQPAMENLRALLAKAEARQSGLV